MKRLTSLAAIAILALLPAALPTAAAPKYKILGTDEAGDAPPGADLTYLEIGRNKKDLEIRIGIAGMLPVVGGYETSGVEWAFKVNKRTFLAEAYPSFGDFGYLLFEIKGDTFERIGDIDGTYDAADGFVRLLVPLKMIGAKPGMRIRGARIDGVPDVDIHTHLGPITHRFDEFETDKSYVVPRR